MKIFNFIQNSLYLLRKQLVLNGKNKLSFLWSNKLNIDKHSFLVINCALFRDNVINMNDRFNRGKLLASIASSSPIMKSKFDLMATENTLNICGGGVIVNAYFLFVNGHNTINIDEKLSLGNEVTFICQEGTEINIGSGCQIANNVTIRTSDSHSILDVQNNRINKAESIRIGNNVWIGQNVIVLKGVNIADNTVIGCMSVCTKKEYQPNSIYVGSPARLVKSDIHWDARQL